MRFDLFSHPLQLKLPKQEELFQPSRKSSVVLLRIGWSKVLIMDRWICRARNTLATTANIQRQLQEVENPMSTKEKIVLTRQQLYELVWSKPMIHLAKEFELSDVALAKWCRKMDIPLPGVGYWRRIETGKKARKEKLPSPERTDELRLTVTRYAPDEEIVPPPPREVPEYEAFENRPENQIVVTDELIQPHPLVAYARKTLRGGRMDDRYGWLYPKERGCLDIYVSPDALDRALRFMDAIIKALRERGITVEVAKDNWKASTYALVGNEKVWFGIFESPQKGQKKNRWSGKMENAMVPSGRLVLRIRSEYGRDQCQFRDQKRKALHERLNEFVIEINREAIKIKTWRAEREREQIKWEEKRRKEAEEAENVRTLENYLTNWRKAQEIRAFVEAVRQKYADADGIAPESELGQWLEWANAHANKTDPLTAGQKSA